MNYNVNRQLFAVALLAACAFVTSTNAEAQQSMPPTVPAVITPPAGNSAFMWGRAEGTQGYVCLPSGTGMSWTVNAARPEATVSASFFGEPVQIATHFLSPNVNPNEFAPASLPVGNVTWQSSRDSSKVWGQAVGTVAAGTDASCPNAGAIACVLLQSIGSQAGPAGGKLMTHTTYIQRLNTAGGSAPADGCAIASDVGKQALVPYAADYYFFRADQ